MSVTQQKNRVNGGSPSDPRIAFFDALAPRWESTGPDPASVLGRLQALRPRLGLPSGQPVLELGCGTGLVTPLLAEWAGSGTVVGADFSTGMIECARVKNLRARFITMDICDQPAPERFATVFAFNVFPHLRDQPRALRHLAASLIPGGMLIVLHLMGSAKLNAFHHSLGGAVGADLLPGVAQWPDLLSGAGFSLIEAEDNEDLFLLKARRGGKGEQK